MKRCIEAYKLKDRDMVVLDKRDIKNAKEEDFEEVSLVFKEKDMQIKEIETNLCKECGEMLVCPKCTPIVQKTNSLIIRCKDTEYNGGFPNALIIAPLYTSENKSFSVATLTGDNFYWNENRSAGFTYIDLGTVEGIAETLAGLNVETWSRLFGFPKNRIRFAEDIKKELVKYLNRN